MPTVGRIVHYYADSSDDDMAHGGLACAAIIAHVHPDGLVNLTVFDANGETYSRTSVTLVQPGQENPDHCYCTWMPYQVKKAHGSESGERAAGTEEV